MKDCKLKITNKITDSNYTNFSMSHCRVEP